MEGIDLVQDLAILLLAAGLAGIICKRLGLSVIVGYLVAGVLLGPHTLPIAFIADEARIQALSQVGLVILMFGIGLGLSLTKIGRMGLPTIMATFLGAFFILNFTLLLGFILKWSTMQSLFVAAMFMVSSSAVISKIIQELHLEHERAAQVALAVTIMEDVVAVVMLTLLSGLTSSGQAGGGVASMVTLMSAFVVLLIGAALLLLPRVLKRVDARTSPEMLTIVVAGILFLLSLFAVKAGYSLALGAFLFGAVVAELPQRGTVERSFGGLRDVFSSVFFVSIGMLIDVRLLGEVWISVLALGLFALIVRPVACGFALMIAGVAPREARRGGLLLTPLGEFSFIIAQAGIGAAVLPVSFYPLAVGLSILTVLATPLLNRYSDPILNGLEKIEPKWVTRFFAAYHGWLRQLSQRPAPPMIWKLARPRLVQILIEILFITGLLIFSEQMRVAVQQVVSTRMEAALLDLVFWSVIGLLVLIPLVAMWRSVSVLVMLLAEAFGGNVLPARFLANGLRAIALVGIGYWLYAILPIEQFTFWGWVIIGVIATIVVAVFSSRLIYWHSTWSVSVNAVLSENNEEGGARNQARAALGEGLERWKIKLEECDVPSEAAYAGANLSALEIPGRFGVSVVEIERNGHVITSPRPDTALYPGDKVLLLGKAPDLKRARDFLEAGKILVGSEDQAEEFSGTILETYRVESGPRAGQTLAQLQVARHTGVRIAAIRRGETEMINPSGQESLDVGDEALVLGTIEEIRSFRHWMAASEAGA